MPDVVGSFLGNAIMKKFFDFYEPLERRYVFNSFLIVVALVEVIIFVFTLIWQVDEGVLGGPVRVVPFPWLEYLLVAFVAPIALLFIFGLVIRGFESLTPGQAEPGNPAEGPALAGGKNRRRALFLGAILGVAFLALWRWGEGLLAAATALFKALGLGGTYLLAGLLAAVCLYVTLRLYLNYRLQKRALELQYRQYLAERHGLVLPGDRPGWPPALDREGGPEAPEAPRLGDQSSP